MKYIFEPLEASIILYDTVLCVSTKSISILNVKSTKIDLFVDKNNISYVKQLVSNKNNKAISQYNELCRNISTRQYDLQAKTNKYHILWFKQCQFSRSTKMLDKYMI